MSPRKVIALVALLGVLVAQPAFAEGTLFGGTPVAEQTTEFGGGNLTFSATVYTAVYNGVTAGLPADPLLTPLAPGESLFVYLVHNDGAGGEVDLMALINPDGVPLWRVGYLSMSVDGWSNAARVDPAMLYAGLDSAQFGFSPNFGGRLTPGKWALVYYRGPSGWQPVQGYVGLMSGQLDEQPLLGPATQGVMNPPPPAPDPEQVGTPPSGVDDTDSDPSGGDTSTGDSDTTPEQEGLVDAPLVSNSVLAEQAASSDSDSPGSAIASACGAMDGLSLTLLLAPLMFLTVRSRR